LTSTFGEGDLPATANALFQFLSDADPEYLRDVRFSLCGFGNSDFAKFCEAAKIFDDIMESLGAHRVLSRMECDENAPDR
jgi:sulfite reductase (NADPH) flavoprotein alpha-component